MKRRTVTRAVTAATTVAALAAGWLFLAPAELGGRTEYVIVEGSSMEPLLSSGDLAVVRSDGPTAVGDVVLYRDPELQVDVLHRVTGLEGDRLILKGDSNDFFDDVRPTPADINGSLWFSLPNAGGVVTWMREPVHAALIVFALALLLLAGGPSPVAAGRGASRG
jgi:signal peptidase